MSVFSKNVLPPIVNYSYPSIAIGGGGDTQFVFNYSLSVVNSPEEIDHIQIRFYSMDSNYNGLNPRIFERGLYFIKVKDNKMPKLVDLFIGVEHIFDMGSGGAKPSNYKIQARVVEKNDLPYMEEWGQKPDKEWLDRIAPYTSEWSNTGIVKTIARPDVGIYTLSGANNTNIVNYIDVPDVEFIGWYKSSTKGEYLSSYQFALYRDGEEVETSDIIHIEEYETPSISYEFKEIYDNDYDYIVELRTRSTTDYIATRRYNLKFRLPFSRAYNIFYVDENDKAAYNDIVIQAKQIQLEATDEDAIDWKNDINMDDLGEHSESHAGISGENIIKTPPTFSTPFDDFTLLYGVHGLSEKISTRSDEAFGENRILRSYAMDGTYFDVGVLKVYDKLSIILRETTPSGTIQLYSEYVSSIEEDDEFMIMIKKDINDTVFQAVKWHEVNFKEEE